MTAKVYGLHSGDGVVWYVGQTTQSLSRRLSEHKSRARNDEAYSPPKRAKILAAGDSLHIELLYEGDDADEREADIIRQLRPEVNRQTGGRQGYTLDPQVRDAIASKLAGREGYWRGRSRPEVSRPGAANPAAKLTEDKVANMRFQYALGGVSQRQLAREFGVTQSHVSAIIRGKRWSS